MDSSFASLLGLTWEWLVEACDAKSVEDTLHGMLFTNSDSPDTGHVQVHACNSDHFWVTFVIKEDDDMRHRIVRNLFDAISSHGGFQSVEFEIAVTRHLLKRNCPI